jgi:hypothetical protein
MRGTTTSAQFRKIAASAGLFPKQRMSALCQARTTPDTLTKESEPAEPIVTLVGTSHIQLDCTRSRCCVSADSLITPLRSTSTRSAHASNAGL